MRFARDLPKLITFEPPPCTWFIRKIQKPISSRNGRKDPISAVHEKPPVPFESHLDAGLRQVVLELQLRLVGGVVHGRLLAVRQLQRDRALARVEDGLRHLVRA